MHLFFPKQWGFRWLYLLKFCTFLYFSVDMKKYGDPILCWILRQHFIFKKNYSSTSPTVNIIFFNFKALCETVSILLYFFVLAVFGWMSCEGMIIYLQLVNVYSGLGLGETHLRIFYVIGWGMYT